MIQGNKPWDGGNLILSTEEREALLNHHPECADLVRRYLGGEDYLHGKLRYCLWLHGISPTRFRTVPEIMRRLAAVADTRRKTKTVAVQKQADTPMLFSQIRQPTTDFLVIPEVSSERRRYIPIGYYTRDTIASNKLYIIPDASLWLFGILISNVHMAWMRIVAGRLENRYSYSPAVYNNFPWPDLRASPREKITSTAQAILDARAAHPESTLADLYDPLTMPPDLLQAHRANDRAVMTAYGFDVKMTESDCVAELFKLYERLTARA